MSMMQVEKKALEKALKMLDAIGCRYGVETEDGETFGVALQAEKKRSAVKNPGCSQYCEQQIQNLNIGEKLTVPFGDFDPPAIQSCLAYAATKLFGRGSITTARNDKSSCIEVMRFM